MQDVSKQVFPLKEKQKKYLSILIFIFILFFMVGTIIDILLGLLYIVAFFIALLIIIPFAIREVIVSKNNKIVNIVFIKYFGNKKQKEYNIDLSQIIEYKEKYIGRGCYEMQFLMQNKNSVKILIQMDLFKEFRNYILSIIIDNQITTACNYL